MDKKVNVKYRGWAWGWGIFLLLVAALVLTNQLGGFIDLGIWSIIVAALAVAFMVKCIIDLSFGSLPIPLSALYYIFHAPLGLPSIGFWWLVLITVLVTAGLHVLIPSKFFRKKNVKLVYTTDDFGEVIESTSGLKSEAKIEEGGSDNNPQISVQFGGGSRYLHADSLETVMLNCSFGGLEVYFDHVQLSPNGAVAYLSCKFGAIELYVPREWRIIDKMSSSAGNVEVHRRHESTDDNAPTLTLTGNVSFGGIEVHRV